MEGKLGDERETGGQCADIAGGPPDDFGNEDVPTESSSTSGLFASPAVRVPWSVRDVVIGSALFVPAGIGGSLGSGLALLRSGLVEDRTLAVVVGSMLLPLALLATAWVFGLRRHRVSPELLGFRGATLTDISWLPMVALAIGLSVTGVYALIVEALGIDILTPDQNLEEIGAIGGVAQAPVFAIVGILAPFGEEVFFRGFLLAALLPVMGGLRSAIVSSGVFAVAHLSIGTLLPIFVMGMLLAWLYLRTGSIWPPFAAHAAQNLLALTFLEIPFDPPTAALLNP